MKYLKPVLILGLIGIFTGLGVAETVETGQTNEVDVAGETYEITLETKTKDTATISINEAQSLPLEENEKFTANKVTVNVTEIENQSNQIKFEAYEEKEMKTIIGNQQSYFRKSGRTFGLTLLSIEEDSAEVRLKSEGTEMKEKLETGQKVEFKGTEILIHYFKYSEASEKPLLAFQLQSTNEEDSIKDNRINVNGEDSTYSYGEKIEVEEGTVLTPIYSFPGMWVEEITDDRIILERLDPDYIEFPPIEKEKNSRMVPAVNYNLIACTMGEGNAEIIVKNELEGSDFCQETYETDSKEKSTEKGKNGLDKVTGWFSQLIKLI